MAKNIAIFASGSGSNAENIIHYFENSKQFSFPVIISNKPEAYVHERAKKLKINSVTFERKDFETGEKILELLHTNNIDAIVLAGFLLKVPSLIIQAYPDKIINIHPALLPKYGGKGMYGMNVHKSVVENKEKETGITIHFVNENYDEGNIIFQKTVTLTEIDTPEVVAEKIHELEQKYFPSIVEEVLNSNPSVSELAKQI